MTKERIRAIISRGCYAIPDGKGGFKDTWDVAAEAIAQEQRAERDALRTAGDALVRVLGETFEDGEIGDELVKMAVRGGNINGRWPRIKAALSAWRKARRPQ